MEEGASPSQTELSILIEEMRCFAFECDSQQSSFNSTVKDFEESSDRIQEIRADIESVTDKLHEQYRDHERASEYLKENAELFDEIRQLLRTEGDPITSAEEREAFASEKLILENAIEKYRNEMAAIESQRPKRAEEMKEKHDLEQFRLQERKRSLESQIRAQIENFEQQKTELKVKHDGLIEKLAEKFRKRLSEIEDTKSHRKCQAELASWRASWSETLQGLEVAIERAKEVTAGMRNKKRRSPPTKTTSKKPRTQRNTAEPGVCDDSTDPRPKHCQVILERLEEIPDSSEDLTPPRSIDDTSLALADTAPDTKSSSKSLRQASSEQTPSRRRLFTEEPIVETLESITESTSSTVEGYLRSLQRVVTENSRERRKLKKKQTP